MEKITFKYLNNVFKYCFHEAVKYAMAKENSVVYSDSYLDNSHYTRVARHKVAAS